MTNSPSIEPRRKQWAPRVRTGCRTCRFVYQKLHPRPTSANFRPTRRIKCDETQPDCRRCVSSGRTCQYSLVWRPPGDGQPCRQQTVLSTAPFRQAPLPDADIMEAVRYCQFSSRLPPPASARCTK
ncbi:C6 zinc finger domain [Cordyceps militaris]|uniref:C6 zinc finger domain n=1 Tax=Cordyceps militaris TaxID=73501 RepID=A0A2H4SFP4_CORMI|nr:C6 zinc finger domain [Cordyceps militaris]